MMFAEEEWDDDSAVEDLKKCTFHGNFVHSSRNKLMQKQELARKKKLSTVADQASFDSVLQTAKETWKAEKRKKSSVSVCLKKMTTYCEKNLIRNASTIVEERLFNKHEDLGIEGPHEDVSSPTQYQMRKQEIVQRRDMINGIKNKRKKRNNENGHKLGMVSRSVKLPGTLPIFPQNNTETNQLGSAIKDVKSVIPYHRPKDTEEESTTRNKNIKSKEENSKQNQEKTKTKSTNHTKVVSVSKRILSKNKKAQRLQRILSMHDASSKMSSPVSNNLENVDNDNHNTFIKQSKTDPNEMTVNRSKLLRTQMEQRLESARFRFINEQLYTSSSLEAYKLFHKDSDCFHIYHRGFTAQVKSWPQNPVDSIVDYIKKRPASLIVADFGCGDCKIALSVKNKVHSFDLFPVNKLVTVCDMSKVPLPDNSVDIVVFCLSLMGTNLCDFLVEANRVLVSNGVLKIAEVASRFNDIRDFITALARLGFKLCTKETKNSYFFSFEFIKTGSPYLKGKSLKLDLKPCVYKKR
ncbi:ribosomal RNA-processing protein 8 [Polypterus senegalus]|uniref:ribosomal RNA-processing protein 8 n=1 Tax=Polypterus senegalus TaxID=55291 RepID=UPI001964F54B|nr:ribosomal RNA-processing protein 8 [Polypterus senegalus]